MNRMVWALAAAAVLGAVGAAWEPSIPSEHSVAVVHSRAPSAVPPANAAAVSQPTETATPRQTPGLASVDPFVVWTPPPSVMPSRKIAPPPPPPPAVEPVMPAFPYRVFGMFRAPDGKRMIYLVRNNRIVAVEEEMDLGDGFKVEGIGESSVRIVYQPLGEKLTLPVPEASR